MCIRDRVSTQSTWDTQAKQYHHYYYSHNSQTNVALLTRMANNNKNKYSVILPTFNEKENLPIIIYLLFEMAEKENLDFEVVIVEDNSPDGTLKVNFHQVQGFHTNSPAQVAQELEKIYKGKIKILPRAGKLGLGTAYRDGLKLCDGNFIILMDADLSHHPKYLPEFIKRQRETDADIVTGSRYRPSGGVYGWGLTRKLVSKGANFLASTFLASKCSDLTGSFRLYKREVIEKIIGSIVSTGYAFQMEIIIRANNHGYQVQEVPIVFVDRIFGDSKMGAGEIVRYLSGLWKLVWRFQMHQDQNIQYFRGMYAVPQQQSNTVCINAKSSLQQKRHSELRFLF
eukprot:TRINITY_DN1914_c0_g1_i2.p1 TRINITY_DN1914_c0_g1~~TRINITY_DN1914_c0_g1_i2.p1  ORF type:complete len:370 (+),score=61.59 TRINITY_DN1914_c0_g1_i2:88-1110(+)